MSNKSVGDRENFIKGLINEAVWLLWVFMHSEFWLWWIWRQECLLRNVHQTLNPASSAASQSNQNFVTTEITFSLTRKMMSVSLSRLNSSTDCSHALSPQSLPAELYRHKPLQWENVHRLHCQSPSLLGGFAEIAWEVLSWLSIACDGGWPCFWGSASAHLTSFRLSCIISCGMARPVSLLLWSECSRKI